MGMARTSTTLDKDYAGNEPEKIADVIETALQRHGTGDDLREAHEIVFFEGELRVIMQRLRRTT
jgi:hypothetical protein